MFLVCADLYLELAGMVSVHLPNPLRCSMAEQIAEHLCGRRLIGCCIIQCGCLQVWQATETAYFPKHSESVVTSQILSDVVLPTPATMIQESKGK